MIAAVDKSFASNAEDALLTYPRRTDNADPISSARTRGNFTQSGRRSSS